MAKITRTVSARTDARGMAEIRLRLSAGRGAVVRLKSGLYVRPERLRADGSIVLPRAQAAERAEMLELEARLGELEAALLAEAGRPGMSKATLEAVIAKFHSQAAGDADLLDWIARYLQRPALSAGTKISKAYMARKLWAYCRKVGVAHVAAFSEAHAAGVAAWLASAHLESPDVAEYPALLRPSERPSRGMSANSVSAVISGMKGFFNFCVKQGAIERSPFMRVETPAQVYGRPVYLTVEERDRLAAHDLSEYPAMEDLRDVFVFQCLTGCRYSDLVRLTRANIIDGVLEYVPKKTQGKRAVAVRVPLKEAALAIVERRGRDDGPLLNVPRVDHYNAGIRGLLRLAGVTRTVTVLDSHTGQPCQRPICDVASSHMARRTFAGNLYKAVQDPALVGSMTGHVNGSASFARYRDIDDDIKRSVLRHI